MSIQDDIAAYRQQPSNIQQDIAAYQNQGSTVTKEPEKVDPSFLQKLDMINSGVNRGVTHFTLALMSKLPFGDKYQQNIKNYDAAVEAEQQNNIKKYNGYYPQVGEGLGETLATLPAGGLLGYAAPAAAGIAPLGLKTAAKYGAAAAEGAGVLSGVESQRYDPNKPGQLFNTDAAKASLNNPVSYILPAAGEKLNTWVNASKALGEAKQVDPYAMARDLKYNVINGQNVGSPTQKLSNEMFDPLSFLTGFGKRAAQLENIGTPITNFIAAHAGNAPSTKPLDLIDYAGKQVDATLNKINNTEDALWNKPFINKPITDPQSVKNEAISALDAVNSSGIPIDGFNKQMLNLIRQPNMDVNQAKKIQSLIGDAAGKAINNQNATGGYDLYSQLKDFKSNIIDHIQTSLTPDSGNLMQKSRDLNDFAAARQFTANKQSLYENAPLVKAAIGNEANAQSLINNLVSESGVMPPKKAAFNILNPEGQNSVEALKVANALKASDSAGKINLQTFLDRLYDDTQTEKILRPDTYKALQGLNQYLTSVKNAGKGGWWKQAALLGMTGLGAAAGGVSGHIDMTAPLATYGAALMIANHSPLKSLLGVLPKNLSEGTYNFLTNAVGKHLSRAGMFISNDGVLRHKDEPIVPDDQGASQQ